MMFVFQEKVAQRISRPWYPSSGWSGKAIIFIHKKDRVGLNVAPC